MAKKPKFNDSVFINCPFDRDYAPLFEIVVFTILACGFVPRCAREESDSGDIRLEKLIRLIGGSRYGIHDLSRIELDQVNGLPRFNMPFELGIDVGCRKLGGGDYGKKRLLIMDAKAYRYQKFLSDIAGQDILTHGNAPEEVLKIVRRFLLAASRRRNIPGDGFIREQYRAFAAAVPALCAAKRVERDAQGFLEYLDYRQIAEEWLGQAVGR